MTDKMISVPQMQPCLGKEEADAVYKVVESGWITEGAESEKFSRQLNKMIGCDYGVFAPNGTLALYLGLVAMGIGVGDEVLVPDTTFIASANAVIMAGATPVFVDVNRRNFQIDVADATKYLSNKTKAIMPVHLYGMIANMSEVMEFSSTHDLLVIEDAAQALGVHYKGQHSGTFGDVGCFSFFADKTMTTAEGGYVVCQTEETYKKLLYLRNQGRLDRGSFVHPEIGYNFRITDMHAAMGLVQLKKLNWIIQRKHEIYSWYREQLETQKAITFLEIEPGSEFVPFRTVVLAERLEALMEYLNNNGVGTRGFFYPLHKQPCYQYMVEEGRDLSDENYPNATYGNKHGLCLATFPTLEREQVDHVCKMINDFYSR